MYCVYAFVHACRGQNRMLSVFLYGLDTELLPEPEAHGFGLGWLSRQFSEASVSCCPYLFLLPILGLRACHSNIQLFYRSARCSNLGPHDYRVGISTHGALSPVHFFGFVSGAHYIV